jgi:uncharacterized Ntn-hydrolase superfamily protein
LTGSRVYCFEFAQIKAGEQAMPSVFAVFLACLLSLSGVLADTRTTISTQRPVHTYSIVARDPETGQLGVAVQSHWFSTGTLVPWARAGVGAVATQSFVDVRYGTEGLALMQDGRSAQDALKQLLREDPTPGVRQVGMIDASGNIAQHTGAQCIQHAGHLAGENFAVQANLMMNEGVPKAMAKAFRQAQGPLAERMLMALFAAQATGGDLRGKQSAAILVVKGKSSGRPWVDRLVDLHIEDSPQPLVEMRRLLKLNTAYAHMNQGDHALESGDVDGALAEYGRAQALFPDNVEMKFWHAVSLVNAGRVDKSLPIFRAIFSQDAHWRELVVRLNNAGLLEADREVLVRITGAGSEEEE